MLCSITVLQYILLYESYNIQFLLKLFESLIQHFG